MVSLDWMCVVCWVCCQCGCSTLRNVGIPLPRATSTHLLHVVKFTRSATIWVPARHADCWFRLPFRVGRWFQSGCAAPALFCLGWLIFGLFAWLRLDVHLWVGTVMDVLRMILRTVYCRTTHECLGWFPVRYSYNLAGSDASDYLVLPPPARTLLPSQHFMHRGRITPGAASQRRLVASSRDR